jgi:hypothetical protein
MRTATRQHFVPRFYLAGFTDPAHGRGDMLWVYESGKEPRPSRPEACGYENCVYDFFDEGERRSLEEEMTRVDCAAAEALRRLGPGCAGTGGDWGTLLEFISLQAVRVPSMLRRFDAVALEGAARMDLSEGAVMLLRQGIAAGRHRLQSMAEMAGEAHRLLGRMGRVLVTPDDDGWTFLTCDAPFGVWTPSGVAPTLPGIEGSPEADICFPIRRDLGVIFTRKRGPFAARIPPFAVRDFNRIVIRSAERFVLASERSEKIQGIVNKKTPHAQRTPLSRL